MQFDNFNGLYALLSLIPLIIIYLKRPRPIQKSIPSLMFIMKSTGFSKAHTLFRTLIHNLLFFIQLSVLIFLSLAIAVPYMDVPAKYVAKHNVIIIDISASMHAGDRFVDAKKIAKDNLGGKNSIIVVSQNPYIAGTGVGESRGKEIIDQVTLSDSVTNLGSAILASENLLNETGGRVVVISDFISTLGMNPIEAKRILASKNINVEFFNVAEDAKNVGIIDLEVGNDNTKITLKNYNNKEENVKLSLIKDGNEVDKLELKIPAGSVEIATVDTLPGKSKIELEVKDDFSVDNEAYISSPKKERTNVLLITNQKNSNVEIALRSSPRIALTIEEPPRVSSFDYDVIIFSKINPKILLPSTPDNTEKKVRNGASAVIIAQQEMKSINWFGLVPVTLGEYLNESTINVEIFNRFSSFLQKGEAGKYSTPNYFNGTPKNDSIVIATADDESPLIAIKKIDKGKTVYLGIEDDKEFILSQDYPVFWNNLIEFLVERGDISDYNKKFTDFYTINITEQGIYNIQGKDVSLNLLDEKESNVGLEALNESGILKRNKKYFETEESMQKAPYSFEKILLLAVLLLFAAELFILKLRGDL